MRLYSFTAAAATVLIFDHVKCLASSLLRERVVKGVLSKLNGTVDNFRDKKMQPERRMNEGINIDILPSLEKIVGLYLPEENPLKEHSEESLYLAFSKRDYGHKMKLGFITKTGPGERYKKATNIDGYGSPWFNVTLNRYTGYLQLDQASLSESQRDDFKKFLERLTAFLEVDEKAKLEDIITLEVQEDNIKMSVVSSTGDKERKAVLFTKANKRQSVEITV
ncbi:hypothetical protein FOL47_007106 [Perkinsus chesapeaki]|uniref:Uncharacterized protein n=1 Tax=Perkinsus chesapeaki TaxID=330153 RepID=A0A7J6MW59_PERCH|nr:hypothetical protein FOL47_007106 [Perkinsus chesapeaki]